VVPLLLIGVLTAGAPQHDGVVAWLVPGALVGAGLTVGYIGLLRADLTMLPVVLATMTALAVLLRGSTRAFEGALAGSLLGAVLSAAVGWWWFCLLRRSRDHAAAANAPAAVADTI
jgi:hypothetical protein